MSEQVYEESIEVDADPQRVWEVLIDVEFWPEWTPSMTTVEVISPGPLRPRVARCHQTAQAGARGDDGG